MLGQAEIFDALNVAGVQAVIDSYGSGHAIFADIMMPPDVDLNSKTINFYLSSPVPLGETYQTKVHTVNCRAGTYGESQEIAAAALTAINRVNYTDYYIVCQVMPTIPPASDADNYNTAIEATIKMR